MKKLTASFNILAGLLLSIPGVYEAQQNTLISGDDADSGKGAISYTMGQLLYESLVISEDEINPGVQQSFEIFTLPTQEAEFHSSITVYPNPVEDFLIIDLKYEKLRKLRYHFFEGSGRLIKQGELKNHTTEISTSSFTAGLYILNITSERKKIQTFKIIKN